MASHVGQTRWRKPLTPLSDSTEEILSNIFIALTFLLGIFVVVAIFVATVKLSVLYGPIGMVPTFTVLGALWTYIGYRLGIFQKIFYKNDV